MPVFDACAFVDWSAASVPVTGPNSVWIAAGESRRKAWLSNCPTRDEAQLRLTLLLSEWTKRGLRVLVGWDFPIGYPAALPGLLGVNGMRGVWDLIASELVDVDNRSNRFALAASLNARLRNACPAGGPFWGCAVGQSYPGLTARKPAFAAAAPLPEWRLCELALRAQGLRPQSVWQLYGAGSCGSQALTGIPRLLRIREHPALRACSRIWPFETGFALPRTREGAPLIVHAECWPGAIDVDLRAHKVKDAAQMHSLLRWARREDAQGTLAARFGRPAGMRQSELARAKIEGWVL